MGKPFCNPNELAEYGENRGISRTLGLQTAISYLRQKSKPVLSFTEMESEPSYLDVGAKIFYRAAKRSLQRGKSIYSSY